MSAAPFALLFAGQGSEEPRMGLELAARDAHAHALLDRAGALAGVSLARELERMGPSLRRTAVLQPALVAVALGAARWLSARGATPTHTAGHSLGELCAWSVAGGADDPDALALAWVRGAAMERAAQAHPGGMLALTDADEALAQKVVRDAHDRGASVFLAAHNAPREWVLSGDAAALRAIARAHRASMLPVAGPWHSDAMSAAMDPFRAALEGLAPPTHASATAWVSCTSARVEPVSRGPALLPAGLVRMVRWVDTLRVLYDAGARCFVIAGPGRALRAAVRRTLGEAVAVHLADDARAVEQALRSLER